VPLVRGLKLGHDPDNDVVLNDPAVSRRAELAPGLVLTVGATRLYIGCEGDDAPAILGESAPMRALRALIARLAPASIAVLVSGETGTGKELVARALHEQSGRRGPFVPLNCGSIARDLVESELFGHERGAFTGATERREGVFQAADGGTLFLDEIGELPLGLQTRLLRALESGVVRPLGAQREVRVNVRVVAATHVDLRKAVMENRFRHDLFFRLAGAVIVSPPLRERADDVPLLARRFLDDLAREHGRLVLAEDAERLLRAHPWPGNVRELRNVLRRAAALGGPIIHAGDLVFDGALSTAPPPSVRVDRRYDEIERDVLEKAITRNGSCRAAARALGIPKSTLCDKAKKYDISLGKKKP